MDRKNYCEICGRTNADVQIAYCTSSGKYLCSKHKNQWHRHGSFLPDAKPLAFCEVCGRNSKQTKVYKCSDAQMVLCVKHIAQFKKYGKFSTKTNRDPNDYAICGDHAELILVENKTKTQFNVLIDNDDLERCLEHRWILTEQMGNTRYVYTLIDGKRKSLHRFILDPTSDKIVDHINRNGLDNRKCNLRLVTPSENSVNSRTRSSTGQKNIYDKDGKYQVQIIRNYHTVYVETFSSLDEAVIARDRFIDEYNMNHNRVV